MQFLQVEAALASVNATIADVLAVTSDAAPDVVGENSGVIALMNAVPNSAVRTIICDLHVLSRMLDNSIKEAFGAHVRGARQVVQLDWTIISFLLGDWTNWITFHSKYWKGKPENSPESSRKRPQEPVNTRWWTVILGLQMIVENRCDFF